LLALLGDHPILHVSRIRVNDAGQGCTVPEQKGPKETFIEQTDQ
jgi:hypothetical protein